MQSVITFCYKESKFNVAEILTDRGEWAEAEALLRWVGACIERTDGPS